MAERRLVRCDQGHVFDAGAGPSCPDCGWRVPEAEAAAARTEEPERRASWPLLAGAAALVLVLAAGLALLLADGEPAATKHGAEPRQADAPGGNAEKAEPPTAEADPLHPDSPAGTNGEAKSAAVGETGETGAAGPPPEDAAPPDGPRETAEATPVRAPDADGVTPPEPDETPEDGAAEAPVPPPQGGNGAESAGALREESTALLAGTPDAEPSSPSDQRSAGAPDAGDAVANTVGDTDPPDAQATPPLPDSRPPADAPPAEPPVGDAAASADAAQSPAGADPPRGPATPEAGLGALLAVPPDRLAAARTALAAPPPGPVPEEMDILSPHAEAERALGLSHALRHALALARAERAAARGRMDEASAAFEVLARDPTIAGGMPNPRAAFGLGVVLWRSATDPRRSEGARLLGSAAEDGGLTGAVDLLLTDRAMLEASGLSPEALAPVLETAYLQSPARFAAQLSTRGMETAPLASTASALRRAARSGDTRAFAQAFRGAARRPAPVLESLLAVTLEGDAKLRPTPRAAERQLVAALVSALAGVTDGRVSLAMLAERGQAGVAAHLPDAVLWLVLALSDLEQGHAQRAGIDRLLRDWAGRLPPQEAGMVARIAVDFGVR